MLHNCGRSQSFVNDDYINKHIQFLCSKQLEMLCANIVQEKYTS